MDANELTNAKILIGDDKFGALTKEFYRRYIGDVWEKKEGAASPPAVSWTPFFGYPDSRVQYTWSPGFPASSRASRVRLELSDSDRLHKVFCWLNNGPHTQGVNNGPHTQRS